MLLTHLARGFFTLPVDFSLRDESQDRRVCAEIHGWVDSTVHGNSFVISEFVGVPNRVWYFAQDCKADKPL